MLRLPGLREALLHLAIMSIAVSAANPDSEPARHFDLLSGTPTAGKAAYNGRPNTHGTPHE
ncbi:hypothetical protein [Tahibacter amnicola]|uniref:Uncharacterized protein n=1 Tax=Tahibacter amnicola TaxID=2976241 RepID=A0ABY6BML3_9GAMM|nr:hypothetical protein [Tahibacter amnicola]UXI70295.1 hypothetical protein N4264_11860 [Tahibacter amnicola]